jgi:hypothetical protein
VRKSSWLILSAIVLLFLTVAHGIAGFALGAAALAVPYVIGCRLHPRTRHRACGGTGGHRSPWYPWAERRCPGCVGGRQIRHGTRVLGMPHSKAEHERNSAALAKRRQERSWR